MAIEVSEKIITKYIFIAYLRNELESLYVAFYWWPSTHRRIGHLSEISVPTFCLRVLIGRIVEHFLYTSGEKKKNQNTNKKLQKVDLEKKN